MRPPGSFQPWGNIAFQPHIIFSKNNMFAGPSHFYIHLNKSWQGNLTYLITSSTPSFVCHTTWSLRQILILHFVPTQYTYRTSSPSSKTPNKIYYVITIIIWYIIIIIIRFSGWRVLLSDLVLDTSHNLDSYFVLGQLQHSIKAVKFWCGNNVIHKIFLPILQMWWLKEDLLSLSNNRTKKIHPRLYCILFHKKAAIYSDPKKKRPSNHHFRSKTWSHPFFLRWS